MILFGNSRKDKNKWASVVMDQIQPDIEISEEILEAATEIYINQHIRILYESIEIALSSKNTKIKKSRYELAENQYRALLKIQKYADKNQKKVIHQAIDDFIVMEDNYKHSNRAKQDAMRAQKQMKKDEFWEAYGTMEMIDIFLGDDD